MVMGFDFLKKFEKMEDKMDIAKTSLELLDVATHFLVAPKKKRIYVWCKEENVERVKEIIGKGEVISARFLRGGLWIVVATY
ncbi:MAG: hypothetical protein DRP88_04285 [Candidatus Neomarinimicrobiota bacterium]|nr:MAG: hypothetical protein DRP88_04285 [Candidatus Neomarinimicrobiota bacterium]